MTMVNLPDWAYFPDDHGDGRLVACVICGHIFALAPSGTLPRDCPHCGGLRRVKPVKDAPNRKARRAIRRHRNANSAS